MIALKVGWNPIADLFIDHPSCELNYQDPETGYTALMIAARHANLPAFKKLMEKSAVRTTAATFSNKKGQTVWDLIRQRDFRDEGDMEPRFLDQFRQDKSTFLQGVEAYLPVTVQHLSASMSRSLSGDREATRVPTEVSASAITESKREQIPPAAPDESAALLQSSVPRSRWCCFRC